MTTALYDPETSLDAYYADRTAARPSRLWSVDKLVKDMAQAGILTAFVGSGSDPTSATGYDSTKLWIRIAAGVTDAPGELRCYDGEGDEDLLASWPIMDTAGWRRHLDVYSRSELGNAFVAEINASGGTTGYAFAGGPITGDTVDPTLTLTVSNAATARTAIGAAPLASPAFTGTPTVPNVSGSDNSTKAANTAYVDSAVAVLSGVLSGALVFKGAWDASAGTFPGSGSAQTGWFYKVSVAGTVDGQAFTVGDDVYAVANNASTSTYANNWLIIQGGLTLAEIQAAVGFTFGTLAAQSSVSLSTQATGTLQAAQMPALTGDVTSAGASLATTIANDAVSYAKMQNVSAASKLLGRGAASGSGDVEEISLGSGLSMSGTTLSASGGGGGGGGVPVHPQGRLSLTSATAVMTTDVASATTIYWVRSGGASYPSYDGSSWAMRTLSAGLSLALDSNSGHTGYHQSGKVFDLWLANDGGTDRLGTGPAWSSTTSRGSGAGTTEFEVLDGFPVNKNTMTLRFGSASGDTVSLSAQRAVLVGSVYMHADGTTRVLFGGAAAGGSHAWIGISNAWNQINTGFHVSDTTDDWTYASASYRSSNNSTQMRVSYVNSLPGNTVKGLFTQLMRFGASNVPGNAIGFDSTSAASGAYGLFSIGATGTAPAQAELRKADIGFHYMQALEISYAGTSTFCGDNAGNNANGLIVDLWW